MLMTDADLLPQEKTKPACEVYCQQRKHRRWSATRLRRTDDERVGSVNLLI